MLTETRVTLAEQDLIGRALQRHNWTAHWGKDIILRAHGGMAGRSGGTAILARPQWTCLDPLPLECEARLHHLQGVHFEHEETGQQVIVIVYYGHPEMKEVTSRDAARLGAFVQTSNIDVIVGGDFNISDEDEAPLSTDGPWLDAHYYWAVLQETTPQATFHTDRSSRRVDRIFLSPRLAQFIQSAGIDEDVYVHGHTVISVAIRTKNLERRVQIAPTMSGGPKSNDPPGYTTMGIAEGRARMGHAG